MSAGNLKLKKILLVDNNKVILRLLSQTLQRQGHEVKTAESGLNALEILKDYRPDVIFVDLIMPNISGDTLCRIIRKNKEFDPILLVILSAVAAEEQIDYRGFGADACIAKGPLKEMEKHIATIMDQAEKGEQLAFSGQILGIEDVYQREITKELLGQIRHSEITLENMGIGLLQLTWSGRVVLANSTARSFFNTPENELLSSVFLDHFEEEQRQYISNLLHELQPQSPPVEIGENRPVVLNGKYVSLKFVPINDHEQKEIILLINDITRRKRAELKLQEHMSHLEKLVARRTEAYKEINSKLEEEVAERMRINDELEFSVKQWRTTFDTIPDFISVHDKDMKFVSVNKALATFLNAKEDDIPGKTCFELVHNRDSPWPNCPTVQAAEQGRTITEEVDDEVIGFPMLVTCSPFYSEDGRLLGVVRVARDISDQKKIEAEHLALIEKLKDAYHIINESQVVACVWKNAVGWPLQFVSDNVELMTGYPKEDFLSGKIVYSQLIHPEDLERVQNEVVENSSSADATSFSHEPYRIITKQNETKWISDHTEIRRDENGNITHFQGLIQDITQKIQLEKKEQELLVKKEQLKHLESLRTMAGAIAHRFNNAMTAVQGNLELMAATLPNDSDQQQMVKDAAQAAKGASKIGSMMLTYIGQRPPQLRMQDLVDLVDETTGNLKGRLMTVSVTIDRPDSPIYCSVDREQIQEVIGNILTNAVESITGQGRITISFGTEFFKTSSFPIPFQSESIHDGLYSFCRIRDNGQGISQEDQPRIFEPFFSTRFVGRGLGLALTVGIMRTHYGAIIVDSLPGQGSTFSVLLPATPKSP